MEQSNASISDGSQLDGGKDAGLCPMHGTMTHPTEGSHNERWWPESLNLKILRKHGPASNPMDDDFDYKAAVSAVDVDELWEDMRAVLTDSQEWWPADFGHYGPFFIRMSWHSAGTYRLQDGRGGAGEGMQRFAPINSWPDNGNLDKARRLVWPLKQKYGRAVSWADLMVLAGTVGMDDMGCPPFGFALGREDRWEPDEDVYWGPETSWLGNERYSGDRNLQHPLAAVQMGLIYVNPEGPDGRPDPMGSAADIRETFARMAMNDYETAALNCGGHTFGKTHGAADPEQYTGVEPEGAPLEDQGFGWKQAYGSGKGRDTITSGPEVTWSQTPAKWSMNYLNNLLDIDWELTKSPAGAYQWTPKDGAMANTVPDPESGELAHAPSMLTSDLAFKVDPAYREIIEHFRDNPEEFQQAYAKAWYKLTHRDMGPRDRYLGSKVPEEVLLWQDPVPEVDHELVTDSDVADLKAKLLDSGLSVQRLVLTAWASASTYRDSDKRGGANGARIRLEPQRSWEVNEPDELARALETLEGVRAEFNDAGGAKISLADLIVLGGAAAVEQAAKDAGVEITVPFTPGRTDASDEWTDHDTFDWLEPKADAFRNTLDKGDHLPAEFRMVDRSNLLGLTAPEMTVLVGGMRALGANAHGSEKGVLTDRPGVLSTDFFTNLLSMDTVWQESDSDPESYVGVAREGGEQKYTATRSDLVFGSNSELRAVAEVYACSDSQEKFVRDFVAAWDKVMMADRYDLPEKH